MKMSKSDSPYSPPDLSGKPNWQPIEIPALLTNPNSFVSGDPEGDRLRLKYYHDPDENRIIAQTWFGPRAEGPPKHAHGGSMAAVLDEVMGVAGLFAGHTVVAGTVSFNFLKMIPLGSVASAIAWVETVDGKKVHTRGELVGADGTRYADSKGLFVNIGFKAITKLME